MLRVRTLLPSAVAAVLVGSLVLAPSASSPSTWAATFTATSV